MMNDIPAIVVAAGIFLEHCRYVQYPNEREYAEAIVLSKKEATVQEAALEVMRLYFKEERAYNEPDEIDEPEPSRGWQVVDPVGFVKEKERDEQPTKQPRRED